MALASEKDNGRNVFDPTSQGMKAYAQFIDENHSGGGGGGSDNYNDLSNKPKINDIILQGSVTLKQLGIASDKAPQAYSTMPTGYAGLTVLYTGEETDDYKTGGIYRYSGTAWVALYEPSAAGEIPTITEAEIDELFAD